MERKGEKNQFISCPSCDGSGVNSENSFSCKNCGGLGTGAFNFGRFLFWGPKLGVAVIELDHFRKKAHMLINIVAFFIGFLGLVSLVFWVYLAQADAQSLGAFLFWRTRNIYILIFWISLIADMFVYYRLTEEQRKKHKIKTVKYEERNKEHQLPNNWEELKSLKQNKKINIAGGYSEKTFSLIEDAYILADKLKHQTLDPLHLFYIILSDSQVGALFTRLNINPTELISKIKIHIEKKEKSNSNLTFSLEIKESLIDAYVDAYMLYAKKVDPVHLIIPLIKRERMLEEILYDFEIDSVKIFNVIKWFMIDKLMIENYENYRKAARFKPSANMDRAYTSVATPFLNQIGYDLTIAAKWGKLQMCVGRDKEIESSFQAFEGGKNGVLFIGPTGTGKRAVVHGIAQLMVSEDVPYVFKDKRLVEIDVAGLIGGASPAQAEERLIGAINEVARAGNIVVYIENIENIMGISSGGEESLDLAEVLANALDRANIYCFATVTKQNYIKYVENTPLDHAVANIEIEEPKGSQAIQIIESKITALEGRYGVYFSYNAIENVIALSDKLIHDRYLPEKAIDILNSIAVRVVKEKGTGAVVTKDDIAAVISEITKIPVTKLTKDEGKDLLNLEDKIHERMVDQEEAVSMVSNSLRRARANLREGTRPIANFLFAGPTGVGKTELAKAVSQIYFGSETYMTRLDMSEYQHPNSIVKMIGSADGVQGYLTEKVRRSPYSLVLLDELEKAHPDILNLFLQVMDDGRLTDGQGRTIDFTNSIIIATSNAGSLYIQKEVLAQTPIETIKERLINEHLNQVMRPELINRFDGVVVFKPLSLVDVENITILMLKKTEKLLEEKGIGLKVDQKAVSILAAAGFDPKFGARPLRRLLQDRIDNQIANKILSEQLARRDTVHIDENAEVKVIKGKLI
ncbi:MAG: ATP-dependent Clp protease ATP-binding subunit [Patescibacteria group bacterium]|jgi:ATP-dependent Clp protease ATP-binding subunit ClpC|nr:ATP-dependent Clp protease ATP-binding subunit [Patescibacteria group bacterium]